MEEDCLVARLFLFRLSTVQSDCQSFVLQCVLRDHAFCCFEDTSRCPELQNPSGNRPRQGFQHNIFLEENGFEEDRIVARFLTCFGLQLCNPNPQILRAALCSSLGSFIFVVLGNLSHAQDSTTHQGSFQIRSKTRSVSEKAIWKCIA